MARLKFSTSTLLFCASAVLMGLSPQASAAELITVQTRPGVDVKVMVLEPETPPKGVLIAYAGGDGTLKLETRFGQPVIGSKEYANAFLIRNRNRFVEAGYVLLLPDVPSDREKANYVYRLSEHQFDDALPVIDFATQRYGKEPWLIGTSASAMTAGNVASRSNSALAGLILIASVTTMPSSYSAYKTHPEGIVSTRLEEVRIPALVIAHEDDACNLSPPGDTQKIMGKLSVAPRKASHIFSGGHPPKSGPCFALSPHGFYGIEDKVELVVFNFIEKKTSEK